MAPISLPFSRKFNQARDALVLDMGRSPRVTQAGSRMKRKPERKLEKLRRCLLKIEESTA